MQDVAAILIVALAAAFLAHRAWRHVTRRQAGRCSSCPSCTTSDSVPSKPLLSITPMMPHHRAPEREEVGR